MADSINRQENNFVLELDKIDEIIKQRRVIQPGLLTRYHLKPTTDSCDQTESYRKITLGERDTKKPHKTVLMVGGTGIGKTALINTMINYMLDVKREDKVWFEITDDQSDRTQAHSQTSIITVYGFYLPESKTDLTIIDTPGYGNTHEVEKDKEITVSLLKLSKSAEGIHEIDAVCLVIKSTQNRLSDRQIYIFDAVQSLFGRDIAENIVLLFTHSRGSHPKNILTAVKEAKIKCAVNEENQPVFFLFDNCQSDTADEDDDEGEEMLKQSWILSFKGMTAFYSFLNNINPKSLRMTQYVLCQRKQLEENISKMKSHVQRTEQQQNKLKQAQEALEKNKELVKNDTNIEYEVEVQYKDMIDINPSVAKDLLSCTVCKINCDPESRWVIFQKDICTSCKCHYNKHNQGTKYYLTRKRKEKRINEELKKDYDRKIGDGVSSVKKLQEELQELEKEKIKLVMDAFHCVDTLQMIALNTDSLSTLQHIDFLIEKLKEIKEHERAEILEKIKNRAGEEKQTDIVCVEGAITLI